MRPSFAALAIGLWATLYAPLATAVTMIGAHTGFQGDPNWLADLLAFEGQIGRPLAIDSDYDNWADFPNVPRIQWDLQNGRVPMQSWSVLFQSTNPSACATAAAINAGVYDMQLAQQAAAVKALGGTVFVRWNWEMTNNPYNLCFTGFAPKQNLPLAGQEYITAWRHVVDRFRAAGATNVKWIWAPGSPAYILNIWQYFYPGSTYVDWTAVDGYNMVDTPSSFADHNGFPQFDAAMTPLGKPMMISENGAFNDPSKNPDPQTMWIDTAGAYLKQHPEIAAYVYWNSGTKNPPPPPYAGTGYTLSGPGLAAFNAMANDPFFGGAPP